MDTAGLRYVMTSDSRGKTSTVLDNYDGDTDCALGVHGQYWKPCDD